MEPFCSYIRPSNDPISSRRIKLAVHYFSFLKIQSKLSYVYPKKLSALFLQTKLFSPFLGPLLVHCFAYSFFLEVDPLLWIEADYPRVEYSYLLISITWPNFSIFTKFEECFRFKLHLNKTLKNCLIIWLLF